MELRWHFAISTITTAIFVLAVGFVGVWNNPRSRLNRLWAIYNLAIAVWAIGQTAQLFITDLSVLNSVIRLEYALGVFWITPLLVHLVVELCEQSRPVLVMTTYGLTLAYVSLTPTNLIIGPPQLSSPLPGFTIPGPLYGVFLVGWTVPILASLWMLLRAIPQQSSESKRRKLKWFLAFEVIGFAGGVSNYLPVFGIVLWPYTPYGTYAVPLYTLMATYAMVRCDLLDIELIGRRSLVYSLLIASISACYLIVVMGAERCFQGIVGYRSVLPAFVVASLIAFFFNPVRDWIQRSVDRMLFSGTPQELAEQRERLLVEVRRTDQMKAVSTLAAGLAHDIKTPLATIKIFTEELLARGGDEVFRAKFGRIVHGEVERMQLIAQRLLEFAKTEPPALVPLTLKGVLEGTLEFLETEFCQRQVALTQQYEVAGEVLGDSRQLKQVFLNLLMNSLQAVNGHGYVTVSVRERDGHVEAVIADNGCGVSAKDLQRMFEPFFTTKSTGTGLGLAVARGIIEEHGATISAKSQPGQGTSMTVRFPKAATILLSVDRDGS